MFPRSTKPAPCWRWFAGTPVAGGNAHFRYAVSQFLMTLADQQQHPGAIFSWWESWENSCSTTTECWRESYSTGTGRTSTFVVFYMVMCLGWMLKIFAGYLSLGPSPSILCLRLVYHGFRFQWWNQMGRSSGEFQGYASWLFLRRCFCTDFGLGLWFSKGRIVFRHIFW